MAPRGVGMGEACWEWAHSWQGHAAAGPLEVCGCVGVPPRLREVHAGRSGQTPLSGVRGCAHAGTWVSRSGSVGLRRGRESGRGQVGPQGVWPPARLWVCVDCGWMCQGGGARWVCFGCGCVWAGQDVGRVLCAAVILHTRAHVCALRACPQPAPSCRGSVAPILCDAFCPQTGGRERGPQPCGKLRPAVHVCACPCVIVHGVACACIHLCVYVLGGIVHLCLCQGSGRVCACLYARLCLCQRNVHVYVCVCAHLCLCQGSLHMYEHLCARVFVRAACMRVRVCMSVFVRAACMCTRMCVHTAFVRAACMCTRVYARLCLSGQRACVCTPVSLSGQRACVCTYVCTLVSLSGQCTCMCMCVCMPVSLSRQRVCVFARLCLCQGSMHVYARVYARPCLCQGSVRVYARLCQGSMHLYARVYACPCLCQGSVHACACVCACLCLCQGNMHVCLHACVFVRLCVCVLAPGQRELQRRQWLWRQARFLLSLVGAWGRLRCDMQLGRGRTFYRFLLRSGPGRGSRFRAAWGTGAVFHLGPFCSPLGSSDPRHGAVCCPQIQGGSTWGPGTAPDARQRAGPWGPNGAGFRASLAPSPCCLWDRVWGRDAASRESELGGSAAELEVEPSGSLSQLAQIDLCLPQFPPQQTWPLHGGGAVGKARAISNQGQQSLPELHASTANTLPSRWHTHAEGPTWSGCT